MRKTSDFGAVSTYAKIAGAIGEKLMDKDLSAKDIEHLHHYQFQADNFLKPMVDHIRLEGVDDPRVADSWAAALIGFAFNCGRLSPSGPGKIPADLKKN
jgi:hypothetical protein